MLCNRAKLFLLACIWPVIPIVNANVRENEVASAMESTGRKWFEFILVSNMNFFFRFRRCCGSHVQFQSYLFCLQSLFGRMCLIFSVLFSHLYHLDILFEFHRWRVLWCNILNVEFTLKFIELDMFAFFVTLICLAFISGFVSLTASKKKIRTRKNLRICVQIARLSIKSVFTAKCLNKNLFYSKLFASLTWNSSSALMPIIGACWLLMDSISSVSLHIQPVK